MIHVTLWLNIVALAAFFTSLSLALLSWVHKPYRWVKSCLWYLTCLALYQFVFTFYFFMRLYVEDIPGELITALIVVQAAFSTAAVLMLPITILKFLKLKITRTRAIVILIPVLSMVIITPLIVSFGLPVLTKTLNMTLYTYIAVLSLYAFVKSRSLALTRDAKVLRYFYIINASFNLLFLVDASFLHLRLSTDLPAIVLIVPVYILSWALLFIIWFFPVSLISGKNGDELSVETFVKNYDLTPRERDIAAKLLAGKTSGEIGEELFISGRTVETHIYNIFRKCDVSSRIELISLIRKF